MFIAVQFPIADIRSLLDCDTYKLAGPCLPFIDPYGSEFIRCFGPLRNRFNATGLAYEESVYSQANRALRFPALGKYRLGRKYKSFIPTCVFRRFFSENHVTCKVEVGFKNIDKENFYFHTLSGSDLLHLLMELMELHTVIPPVNEDDKKYELKNTGDKLAALYLHGTTKYPLPDGVCLDRHWVQGGNPMMLVDYNSWEVEKLPKGVRLVDANEQSDIKLSHTIILDKKRNTRIRVWLIEKGYFADKDYIRRLRIGLLKLNAEREALKQVLRAIEQGTIIINKGSKASEAVQEYIDSAIRSLSKKDRYGLPYDKLVEVVNSYEDITNQEEREFLLQRLEKVRRSIYNKVKTYTSPAKLEPQPVIIAEQIITINGSEIIFKPGMVENTGGAAMTKISVNIGDGNVFKGSIAVAGTIENSHIVTEGFKPRSDQEEKLQEMLREVNSNVAKLCEQLPEELAKQVANDLEVFVKELVSSNPRRQWYELSAKGILEAAKTCSALVEPITKAINGILALFN